MLAESWHISNAVSLVISIMAEVGHLPTAALFILCRPTLSMTGRHLFGVHVVVIGL